VVGLGKVNLSWMVRGADFPRFRAIPAGLEQKRHSNM